MAAIRHTTWESAALFAERATDHVLQKAVTRGDHPVGFQVLHQSLENKDRLGRNPHHLIGFRDQRSALGAGAGAIVVQFQQFALLRVASLFEDRRFQRHVRGGEQRRRGDVFKDSGNQQCPWRKSASRAERNQVPINYREYMTPKTGKEVQIDNAPFCVWFYVGRREDNRCKSCGGSWPEHYAPDGGSYHIRQAWILKFGEVAHVLKEVPKSNSSITRCYHCSHMYRLGPEQCPRCGLGAIL